MAKREDKNLLFSHRNFFCTMIYRIAHLCELSQNALLRESGMTHQQTQLLAFIYARRNQDVYQRDIEQELCLSSATVSQQLQVLERKGFVTRVTSPQDRRTKKLVLTEQALSMHNAFFQTISDVDEVLCMGFTDVEKTLFMSLLHKAYNNISP